MRWLLRPLIPPMWLTAAGRILLRPALVTDGGNGQSRSALAAVRALGAAGHEVHVTTSSSVSVAGWSRHCQRRLRVPGVAESDYAHAIGHLRAQHDYVSVFPASDASLLALGWPGHHLVHKTEVARAAARAGFSATEQFSFTGAQAMLESADTIPYPVIIKPDAKTSPSALVAWRADHPGHLARAKEHPGALLVQRWLTGQMRAVSGVLWAGEVRAVAHQQYVRTWPNECGVASAAVTTLPDRLLEERLPVLLSGLDGIFQVQLIGDVVIDINPRIYGSMALSTKAGLNLPAVVCRLERGDTLSPTPLRTRPGVRYRWLEGDLRHLAHAVGHGRLGASEAARALRPRSSTAHGDVSVVDPAPSVARLVYALRHRG